MKSLDDLLLIKRNIEEKKSINYYMKGVPFTLEFKGNDYYLSSTKKKFFTEDLKEYKKSIIACLFSIKIPTQNPSSIKVKFILNKDAKAVQITNVTTKSRSSETKKIALDYLRNFSLVEYGDVTIFSKLADFNYNYFGELDLDSEDEDFLNSSLCCAIFFKCKKLLDEEIFKIEFAKIGDKIKIRNIDGRLQRIY